MPRIGRTDAFVCSLAPPPAVVLQGRGSMSACFALCGTHATALRKHDWGCSRGCSTFCAGRRSRPQRGGERGTWQSVSWMSPVPGGKSTTR